MDMRTYGLPTVILAFVSGIILCLSGFGWVAVNIGLIR